MASENQARNKARKNGKGPKKALRGVGVEQLEKQRIEALMKKAEASGTLLHFDHPHHQQLLKYGAFSPNGPFLFPQHQQQQMMINENTNNNNNNTVLVGSGFVPFVGACSNVGAGWIVPNNQNQNNNRVVVGGNYGSGSLLCSRNPFEPSKELSSMPNLHQSQPFDLCLKKTRLNEESNVMRGAGTNTRKERPLEVWSNHHVHDFLGGYMPQPQPSVVSAYPTHHNLDECVEVVAVHRRGNSSSGGRDKVFMEYDFFLEKDGRDTSSKNLKLFPTIGEASSSSSLSLTVSAYGGDTATTDLSSIDLSLKL